jgi:L-fuculose-phosphate aldolase
VRNEVKSVDISGQKVVTMRDAQSALANGASCVLIGESCVVTPSARDFLAQHNIALVANGNGKSAAANQESATAPTAREKSGNGGASLKPGAPNPRLFFTPEAEAIKKEICAVGRKLWMRQFVDGNGGNISYRIGPNEVICTPTLVSKYDSDA